MRTVKRIDIGILEEGYTEILVNINNVHDILTVEQYGLQLFLHVEVEDASPETTIHLFTVPVNKEIQTPYEHKFILSIVNKYGDYYHMFKVSH